jgi:toxin secretion/phage lysis holin
MKEFTTALRDIAGVHNGFRDSVFAAAGILASWIASTVGGLSESIKLLLILMLADYASGLIVAGVFHRSSKTANGRLESRAGWKGLCRKVAVLVLVYICHHIDLTFGLNDVIMSGVVIAFCLNEMLSLVENVGLMGVPIPAALSNAVELLKNHADGQVQAIAATVVAPPADPAAVFPPDPQEDQVESGADQAAEVTHHSGTF